ncbi:Pro-kumamolisin, activation domain-containing protein [Lactarius quietus]|nr:Pro-kumamolisin, activation domain-containing protein [Lactarius quietus]
MRLSLASHIQTVLQVLSSPVPMTRKCTIKALPTTAQMSSQRPSHQFFGAIHVKHSWSSVPDDWTNLGHPAADTTIDLHIALRAQDENALIEALHEVSSPDNPKYGKHLSKEQVAELVAPPTEVPELVSSWLKHHNVPFHGLNETRGSQLRAPRGAVVLANRRTNHTLWLSGFAVQKPLKRRGGESSGTGAYPGEETADGVVEPYCQWAIYDICLRAHCGAFERDRNCGINNEYPSPDDLMMFMRQYRADGLFASYTVALVNGGGYNPTNPEVEPNLDIQFSLGIAYPTRLIFYSTGNTPMDPLIAAGWNTCSIK